MRAIAILFLVLSAPFVLAQQPERRTNPELVRRPGPPGGSAIPASFKLALPPVTSPIPLTNGGHATWMGSSAPPALPSFPILSGVDISRASQEMRPFLELVSKPSVTVPVAEVLSLAPQLVADNVYVFDSELRLGYGNQERTYALGIARVDAHLGSIRGGELDFRQYLSDFADEYSLLYPIENSYVAGTNSDGTPFVALQVYANHKKTKKLFVTVCNAFDSLMTRHERFVNGNLRVDYAMAGPAIEYMDGVDFWIPMVRDGRIVGYLVVTLFGYSIDRCWAGFSDMRSDVTKNLRWTKRQAERSTPTR